MGRWWQVVTLRGGEVVRAETFPERTQALKAAGVSAQDGDDASPS